MKKTIISLSLLISLAVLISCGGKKEEVKEEPKDTAKVEEVAVVKDYAYFNNLAKNLKIEGLELSSSNVSVDTASKYFYYGYSIKNGKEKGADKINVNAGNVDKLGNKEDICVASLEEFEKVQTGMYKDKAGVTLEDWTEIVKGKMTFRYMLIKNISDQVGGQKNYNKYYAAAVVDKVYLDIYVSVFDKNADLAKAADILNKVMDYMAK